MKKIDYKTNKKLAIAFYLAGFAVFASLLGSYIVLAVLTKNELTRNEMILTCVSSFLGLLLSAFGLWNALKNHVVHSFFLAGMHLTLLSLSGFFHNLMPVFTDPSSLSLNPWGVAALAFFVLLVLAGIVSIALPRELLFARKLILILAMTLLIAIEGITFVSDVIEYAANGLGKGITALLSILSAYTHLAPIVVMGIGIAFLFDTTAKGSESERKKE